MSAEILDRLDRIIELLEAMHSPVPSRTRGKNQKDARHKAPAACICRAMEERMEGEVAAWRCPVHGWVRGQG